jgi:hypothetical protein
MFAIPQLSGVKQTLGNRPRKRGMDDAVYLGAAQCPSSDQCIGNRQHGRTVNG